MKCYEFAEDTASAAGFSLPNKITVDVVLSQICGRIRIRRLLLNGKFKDMRNQLLVLTITAFFVWCCTSCFSGVSKTVSHTQLTEKTKNASESSAVNSTGEGIIDVSVIQLISNPEKFDGKYVRLIGFVRLEFEGNAIYLHEDDYKYGLTRNGLWLSLTEGCCGKDVRIFDQKYVLVEGTFSAKNQGHMGLFSGAIEKIKRFQVWADKKGLRG